MEYLEVVIVTLSDILFGLSFIANLLVVAGLWWAAGRSKSAPGRPFWRLIAAAWTATLAGNLVWMAYEFLTYATLPPLSFVDGFYLARYVLIGLALWRFPALWPRRKGLQFAGILVGVALVLWFGHYRGTIAAAVAAATTPLRFIDILGVAIYPPLDAVLVAGGYLRMRDMSSEPSRNLYHLLTLSFGLYGVANLLNFDVRLGVGQVFALFALLLWLLSDLVMGSAVVRRFSRRKVGLDGHHTAPPT